MQAQDHHFKCLVKTELFHVRNCPITNVSCVKLIPTLKIFIY